MAWFYTYCKGLGGLPLRMVPVYFLGIKILSECRNREKLHCGCLMLTFLQLLPKI